MKLFIGWSGETSGKIAPILAKWLTQMFDNHITVVSSPSSIEKGSGWYERLNEMVSAADCGLLCVTFEKEDLQKLVLDMNRLESKPIREKNLLGNFEDLYSRWEEQLQMASELETDEDGAEDMARKTFARLLRRSEKNQALLKKIASRL